MPGDLLVEGELAFHSESFFARAGYIRDVIPLRDLPQQGFGAVNTFLALQERVYLELRAGLSNRLAVRLFAAGDAVSRDGGRIDDLLSAQLSVEFRFTRFAAAVLSYRLWYRAASYDSAGFGHTNNLTRHEPMLTLVFGWKDFPEVSPGGDPTTPRLPTRLEVPRGFAFVPPP